jgi:predicted nuclease of restriction endonuclease-like (RecB) superfamily
MLMKSALTTQNVEQLYREVQDIIETSRATTYRAANAHMVQAYWNIGKLIVEEEQKGEQRAEYGKQMIEALSLRLQNQYGKGFTGTNLKYMRQFYRTFEKGHELRDQLSWTHYRLLLKLEKEEARQFYVSETIACNWNTRTLEKQINSLYYERMLMSGKEGRQEVKKEAENKKETMQPMDIIKDPYVLDFLNLKPNHALYERELEQGLINKLQEFILELGKGFSFVSRQYRITAGDSSKHFYIDLVFYNYILKCFLLIDLKTTALSHQDIGQMDFYVRYFEDKVRQDNDDPTIGLILCTEKDKTIVKYSLLNESNQIFASRYKLYLPTEEELSKELEREKQQIETESRLNQDEE